MKVLILLAIALGVAACATTDPEVARQEDAGQCSGYGLEPGSEAYGYCMMQLAQGRAAADERRRYAMAAAMSGMSDHFYRRSEIQAASAPLTINCLGCAPRNGYLIPPNSRY